MKAYPSEEQSGPEGYTYFKAGALISVFPLMSHPYPKNTSNISTVLPLPPIAKVILLGLRSAPSSSKYATIAGCPADIAAERELWRWRGVSGEGERDWRHSVRRVRTSGRESAMMAARRGGFPYWEDEVILLGYFGEWTEGVEGEWGIWMMISVYC